MKIIKYIIKSSKEINKVGSFFMKLLLRLNGAKIGHNTFISISAKIVSAKSLTIGNDCVIKSNVKIKAKHIKIDDGCIISESCYVTGGDDFLIGKKTFIGKKVRINVSRKVCIGEDVGIGENSVIWTHGYFPPADEGYPITYAPVNIGDGSWISTNIIILPGVTVGKGVIIGAGSVVTKNVEDDSLIAGNPAKFIKYTSSFRSNKEFLVIMESIMNQYSELRFVSRNRGQLKYKLNDIYLYIIDGLKEKKDYIDIPPKSIVIFKNIKESNNIRSNKFKWFDLTKRDMTSKKSKETTKIINVLRSHGIRLVKNYK